VPFWAFVFLLIFRSCILVSVIIRGTAIQIQIVTMFVWQTENLKRNGQNKAVNVIKNAAEHFIVTSQDNRNFEEHCRLCCDALQSGRNLLTFRGTVFTGAWP
jgi:hypothetical protein